MTTNVDQFTNFAKSTIAGGASGVGTPLLSTDTQVYLQAGDGAKFPTTTGGTFMALIGSFAGANELVQCTMRSNDILVLTRGNSVSAPDTNSAQQWAVNSAISGIVSAGNLTHLWGAVTGTLLTGSNVNIGNHLVGNSATHGLTLAAGSHAGTAPPSPVSVNTTDNRGQITFGTGTSPSAGEQVTVGFITPYSASPIVVLTPINATTAVLNHYISTCNVSQFGIAFQTAPLASVGNTVYGFNFLVIQ